MFPNLSIATDNIYKFACLFGLAIILASIFSTVSVYNYTLDRQIALSETIISIEAKKERTKTEIDKLELSKQLLKISSTNQKVSSRIIGVALGLGIVFSIYGAWNWKKEFKLVMIC